MEKTNRFTATELLGIAGGLYGFNEYGKNPLREFAEGLGSAYDGLRTASNVLNPRGSEETQFVDKFLTQVDPKVAQGYKKSSDIGYGQRIKEGSKEALEILQRTALKHTPGINTAPVQKTMDLKAKIIGKTKGWFSGNEPEKNEEIQMTAEPEYTTNYNELAELRLAAIKKREEIQNDINEYSQKLEINRARTGEITKSETKTLEGMLDIHTKVSGVLENITTMKVPEIRKGIESPEFATVLAEAKKCEIVPYDPHTWGESAVLTGAITCAYLGYKGAKVAEKSLGTVYDFGKKAVGTGVMIAIGIGKGLGLVKKRLNTSNTNQINNDIEVNPQSEIIFGTNINDGRIIDGDQ